MSDTLNPDLGPQITPNSYGVVWGWFDPKPYLGYDCDGRVKFDYEGADHDGAWYVDSANDKATGRRLLRFASKTALN